jgi:hypothetical protein
LQESGVAFLEADRSVVVVPTADRLIIAAPAQSDGHGEDPIRNDSSGRLRLAAGPTAAPRPGDGEAVPPPG